MQSVRVIVVLRDVGSRISSSRSWSPRRQADKQTVAASGDRNLWIEVQFIHLRPLPPCNCSSKMQRILSRKEEVRVWSAWYRLLRSLWSRWITLVPFKTWLLINACEIPGYHIHTGFGSQRTASRRKWKKDEKQQNTQKTALRHCWNGIFALFCFGFFF